MLKVMTSVNFRKLYMTFNLLVSSESMVMVKD